MADNARIQAQDLSGNWFTVATVINQDQMIKHSIDSYSKQYKRLVRAVDKNGNILQLGQK